MVLQCEIFEEYDSDKLQDKINEFLSENEMVTKDIFQIKIMTGNDEDGKEFYAIVIFYELEEEFK